ncbi:MAG: YeeE/YedE family protein [Proteobacteria bacterium]|nr:YeeE/YedE family protein [Pseudomonadota bacterium]
METEFTPLSSLIGGILIGFSAVIFLIANGRIAGISGIVSRILPPSIHRSELPQGLLFVGGLILAIPTWYFIDGGMPVQFVSNNYLALSMAGLLVGFGAVFGNGCTSGHGVCGISRVSKRSIVATCIFMTTSFITVLLIKHGLWG